MNAVAKIKEGEAVPVDTFAEAFVKLQAAIKPAIKDTANGAFKGTKYADLGAVWEAVKTPLHDNGFSVIQSPDFEGETMWLKTTVLHVTGEKIEGRYPLRPSKQDPQGYGSALTYARRYSLSAMLGVIADDDDDGNAASARPAAPRPVSQPERHEPVPSVDPDGQVTAWCEQQKKFISECEATEFLRAWKKRNDGALGRLETRNLTAHEDLMDHYVERYDALSQREKNV